MGLGPRRFESFPLRSYIPGSSNLSTFCPSGRLLCLYYPLAADVASITVVSDNRNSRKSSFVLCSAVVRGLQATQDFRMRGKIPLPI